MPPARDRSNYHQTNTNPTCLYAAYWIAFGPHGPRSLPPPGENKKVVLYTLIGVGFSFALFASMRAFAKPGPSTMTKEWQEATNEYLKVSSVYTPSYPSRSMAANQALSPEPKLGPVDRYLIRRLFGQGPCAIPLVQGVIQIGFLLSIDASSYTADYACRAGLERGLRGDGALVLLTGGDIGWCKYCTTLTMRHCFLDSLSSDLSSSSQAVKVTPSLFLRCCPHPELR